jgi:prepilin-type processing-associated H-X9-DG protein
LVSDSCYFYLGHAVTNDAEVETFCNGYKEAIRSGTSWQKALHVSPGQGFEGSDVIPLLGEIAEGKASRVPIMIERHQNHPGEGHGVGWFFAKMLDGDSPLSRLFKFPGSPNDDVALRVPKDSDSSLSQCYEGGGHVLYLDGHVEFKKYPDEWPMTPKTVEALEGVHALQREQK